MISRSNKPCPASVAIPTKTAAPSQGELFSIAETSIETMDIRTANNASWNPMNLKPLLEEKKMRVTEVAVAALALI